MTPQAQEAFTVAEAAWYEANGIEPDPATDAWAHKLAQDMWAKALQWAAQQAQQPASVTAAAVALRRGHDRFGVRLRADDRRNLAAELLQVFADNITPSPEGKP